MSAYQITRHALRDAAQQLAATQPFAVQVDAFVDLTHFDGPRYYCVLQVQALHTDWQDAGEAENPSDALENLAAALLVAKCRLARLETEFFQPAPEPVQNFSNETVEQLLARYQRADTAAQLVYARHRAYGACAEVANAMRRARYDAVYTA